MGGDGTLLNSGYILKATCYVSFVTMNLMI